MSIDPKADARRVRGVVEDWREPASADNARRWLISVTLDLITELAPNIALAEVVADLLAMPLPTLRATALTCALAAGVPDVHAAARAEFSDHQTDRVRERLFPIARILADGGDIRTTLSQASAREWVLRALAAAVGLSTRMGKSEEPAARQQAALERLNPAQLASSARSISREERFSNALADLARELAAGRTPAAVTYRGL